MSVAETTQGKCNYKVTRKGFKLLKGLRMSRMTYYFRAEMKSHFFVFCDLLLFYCHKTPEIRNTELRCIKWKSIHCSFLKLFCSSLLRSSAQQFCAVPQSLTEPTLTHSITGTKVFIYCHMKLLTLFLVQMIKRA